MVISIHQIFKSKMNTLMTMILKIKVMMVIILHELLFFLLVGYLWNGIKGRSQLLVISIPPYGYCLLIEM